MPGSTEIRTKYLSLQQDADFALWRAREANAELRRSWDRGEPPPPQQVADLLKMEELAEQRYRELRAFLREFFAADGPSPA